MEFDFSQPVTDLNKVPQDFRGLYVTGEDGKISLNSENEGVKAAVSAITGLNKSLKAARAEAKAKQGTQIDLSPLKEYGEAPDAIAAKIKETIEGLQGQIKGVNIDKIKTDLASEWNTKVDAATKRATGLEQFLHQELVVNRAVTAIAGAKGDPELLLPFVAKSLKAGATADGKYAVNVVDDAGDIRYSGVTGQPMTIQELVAEMKGNEKYGRLFASEAAAGGGAQPGAASGKAGNGSNLRGAEGSDTPMGKIAAGLRKGLAKAGK